MIVACIPFHNDFATIGKVLEKTIKYVDVVIVIDDGSNPPLSSILSKAVSSKKVVLIRSEGRKGYGSALKQGLLLSRRCGATFAVTLDADAQHDPDEIPKFINELLSSNADIVLGNRFKGSSDVPIVDAMLIKLISFFSQLL
jgi:glycosyltransferase involved in cell wall biosynthesis